jgi:hypothetical protein
MTIYKISCFNNKNCLSVGDRVRVIGKQGLTGEVKAEKIVNLTKKQPDCKCTDPDFETKLITKKFDKEGEVTYIITGNNEFHFDIDC